MYQGDRMLKARLRHLLASKANTTELQLMRTIAATCEYCRCMLRPVLTSFISLSTTALIAPRHLQAARRKGGACSSVVMLQRRIVFMAIRIRLIEL